MTIDQGNELIAKYLGLKLKADNKTWELDNKLQAILKVKTTQFLKFNESLNLMLIALEKISTIKDLWITTQFWEGKCAVFLYYKAQDVEGEYRNAKFATSREKSIDKYKQALFEVITNFCGWLEKTPDCQSEIEYELHYVKHLEESSQNIVYMTPKELYCPDCKKTFVFNESEKLFEETMKK